MAVSTLDILQALIVDDKTEVGDSLVKQAITLTSGQVYCAKSVIVADNFTAVNLWTTLEGGMATYSHGFIHSNQDLIVEIRTDKGTAEFVLIKVPANVLAFLPGVLGGNTTESLDGAILVSGTDFDNADRIEVQRDVADAVGDASVSLYLFN
ncbi:hypothetical protein LCGC14_1834750 [marine sediment metagenome]|uniref:Uncharacterized protein n=1 Tax=marine sediment metagenome TaxID=412755 RepID=A0A0F9IUI5_9ZZZZ